MLWNVLAAANTYWRYHRNICSDGGIQVCGNANSQMNMLCSNSVWCCYIANLCFVLEDPIHQIVFLDAVTRVAEEPGCWGDYVIENFVLSEGLNAWFCNLLGTAKSKHRYFYIEVGKYLIVPHFLPCMRRLNSWNCVFAGIFRGTGLTWWCWSGSICYDAWFITFKAPRN